MRLVRLVLAATLTIVMIPAPALQVDALAGHRQCGSKLCRGVEAVQRPTKTLRQVLWQAEQPGRLLRKKRNLHQIQRVRDAFAGCLKPGLFSRPQAEKCLWFLL